MIGIYQITNKKNNKKYIGKSSNVFNRLNRHVSNLISRTHINDYMQRDFNKYGYNGFIFEILEICDIEEMDNIERDYINNLDPENDYNIVGCRKVNSISYAIPKKSKYINNAEEKTKEVDDYIYKNYVPGQLIRVKRLKEHLRIKDRMWKDKIMNNLKNAKLNNNKRLERI